MHILIVFFKHPGYVKKNQFFSRSADIYKKANFFYIFWVSIKKQTFSFFILPTLSK